VGEIAGSSRSSSQAVCFGPGQERHVEAAAEQLLRHRPRHVEKRLGLVERAEFEEAVDPRDEEAPVDPASAGGSSSARRRRLRSARGAGRRSRGSAAMSATISSVVEPCQSVPREARRFGRDEPHAVGQRRAERQRLDLGIAAGVG
jgi:hypothetical protein